MKNPLKYLKSCWQKVRRLRDPVSDYLYLATVDSKRKPHVRTILLKTLDQNGIGFVTNRTGPKVLQMRQGKEVECCFSWPSIFLQVRIAGKVVPMSRSIVEKLWQVRPRAAQILYHLGLKQSGVIPSFEYLLGRVSDLEKKWHHKKKLTKAPNYIGFVIKPKEIEFLNHSPDRLNKRELFVRQTNGWKKSILAP